jgi:hypothetical protein
MRTALLWILALAVPIPVARWLPLFRHPRRQSAGDSWRPDRACDDPRLHFHGSGSDPEGESGSYNHAHVRGTDRSSREHCQLDAAVSA